MGPDHILPRSKTNEKNGKRRDIKHVKDMGIQTTAITDRREKTGTGTYYTGAIRVKGLHNLLSHNHRPNGKGIQMPVGDISKVGGGKGRLRRLITSLQHLMDCAVPLEEQ